MYDVLYKIVFGNVNVTLDHIQYNTMIFFSCLLVVLAFSFISIALYKLMLFICKF